MRFLYFAITLFLAGFIFTWVYSLAVGPLVMLIGGLGSRFENSRLLMPAVFVLLAVGFVIQVFIILWWDAYVVTKTILISRQADYPWLYVVFGFIFAVGPLGYMASKEAQMDRAAGDPGTNKGTGTCLFLTICLTGYFVFYFFPKLMDLPYGWFLSWWFS